MRLLAPQIFLWLKFFKGEYQDASWTELANSFGTLSLSAFWGVASEHVFCVKFFYFALGQPPYDVAKKNILLPHCFLLHHLSSHWSIKVMQFWGKITMNTCMFSVSHTYIVTHWHPISKLSGNKTKYGWKCIYEDIQPMTLHISPEYKQNNHMRA